MNLDVKRNLQFTKLLKADGRLREFNFTRHTGNTDGVFTVDVVDERGNRIIFKMKLNNDKIWEPETGLPSWIALHTPTLQEAIETELNSFHKKILKEKEASVTPAS
ncbi:MAG: hypothetical protein K2X48_09695 [Chitinophagaceae bacterium]|nr:hypothetical protein [Chitinophagaceae bacterium]